MFKVVCINDNWATDREVANWLLRTGVLPPQFGVTYTVIQQGECECGRCKKYIYTLLEIQEKVNGDDVGWEADHFAPISEIDEKEMVRESFKELV